MKSRDMGHSKHQTSQQAASNLFEQPEENLAGLHSHVPGRTQLGRSAR